MRPFKTLNRKTILNLPPYLSVETHDVELPDGDIIHDWAWVKTPDFINVVAITQDNRYLCFQQTKYSVKGTTLAPVGGYIEEDEEPLAAAKRELLEEMGYQSEAWENLGEFALDGNRGVAVAHFFLARNVEKVAAPQSDDLEDQKILLLSRAEVEAAVARGAFKVLPWQTIMALALLRW